jgi:hypothetical protein
VKRHPLDPTSLVLGVGLIVLGVAALVGRLGEIINRPALFVPLAVGIVGVALVVGGRRTRGDETG